MTAFWGHLRLGLQGIFLAAIVAPTAALADDGPSPRYTYLGAGYEWGDSRCAIEPSDGGLSGYTAEGSLGVFKFLHITGRYYDGETDVGSVDLTCSEIGGGLTYSIAPSADIVLRGYWVNIDSDDVSGDADGFEPELGVRFAASDRAEIDVAMAYFDLEDDANEDVTNTEIRAHLNYSFLPWLALRVGGSVFDDDSSLEAGIRGYFGGNLF